MTTLDVCGVTVHLGGRTVLDGVTFSADQGELVALLGVSGSGKTTILRAVAGLDPISAGAIHIGGVVLSPGPASQGHVGTGQARSVGIVFQVHHLFMHLSALDNVSLAPIHVLGRSRGDADRQSRELLDMLGVGERASARPHELSGGEAQRVAIARALAVEPSVLLMDEPTASLDRARRDDLAATLTQLVEEGRTVIVATHDTEFVRACAHRAMRLDHGRIVSEGAPAAMVDRVR